SSLLSSPNSNVFDMANRKIRSNILLFLLPLQIECQSYGPGTHLASVLTVAETELVATYIASFPNVNTNVWIGLHDAHRGSSLFFLRSLICFDSFLQNRKWRWSDGSLFNYKAWKKNEPNNAGGSENCVELWLASSKQTVLRG
ncbi:hypothetical protein lerEdw1_015954, partial [Lerista edwardsae]